MNKTKLIYYISTLMACGIMLFSASMYFMNTEMVKGFFKSFDYPSYLVIPLAVAKILGIVAIITRKVEFLKEWAYAGFIFDGILAFFAHVNAEDNGYTMSGMMVIATLVSYFTEKKLK